MSDTELAAITGATVETPPAEDTDDEAIVYETLVGLRRRRSLWTPERATP
jgi:hypothetical protein